MNFSVPKVGGKSFLFPSAVSLWKNGQDSYHILPALQFKSEKARVIQMTATNNKTAQNAEEEKDDLCQDVVQLLIFFPLFLPSFPLGCDGITKLRPPPPPLLS